MLLPNKIKVENSIYFNASKIISILIKQKQNIHWIDLFVEFQKENKVNFNFYSYCLNWLYLMNIIDLNFKSGEVIKCF